MRDARHFGAGMGSAAMAPLEDLNLRRTEIPRVLQDAATDPYGPRNLGRCASIAQEVRALDEALGPDRDEPPPPPGPLRDRMAAATSDLVIGLVRDAATDFIPGRSWVRRLTGAEAHSDAVQNAIQAGRVRRGFLKGMGMHRNCAPPAAPRWFEPR